MALTPERRRHPRCTAGLPLRLKTVGGTVESDPVTLVTQNFSKSGLCFRSPRRIEPGESIEVEVTLLGAGSSGENLCVPGTGYIVRTKAALKPGWYDLAAVINQPRDGDELGWLKLAATFGELSS